MSLTLHMGVRRNELGVFHNHLNRLTSPVDIELFSSPETWDHWLSQSGDSDGREKEPYIHVWFTTLTPMVMIQLLATKLNMFLVPASDMIDGYSAVQILVTDTNASYDEYIELRYP